MTASTESLQTDHESEPSSPKATETPSNPKEEPKEDSNDTSNISDDDDENSAGGGDNAKRFLPAYKKANAALTFPEKVRRHQRWRIGDQFVVFMFTRSHLQFFLNFTFNTTKSKTKMMNLMKYVEEKNKVEKEFCISWLPEGKAFVIYNIKEFTNSVIPKFFKASKFCSFTRKRKFNCTVCTTTCSFYLGASHERPYVNLYCSLSLGISSTKSRHRRR
jgi:hypothetical protein